MLPKLILVPTDFSENAGQALDYACELAVKVGAKVHVVHAVTSPPSALQVALSEEMIEGFLKEHREELEKLVEGRRASTGANIGGYSVEVGDPRDLIVNTAKEIGAEMIIMGTQGRRGLARMVMGSVAEDVIRHSPCPVLAVRDKQGGG